MQFLISMHINPAVLDALTDEQKSALGGGHGTFIEALKKSGELITTQALIDPSQAAVVLVRDGQPVVTDGPFLDAKQYLGGFYLIDCDSRERAIELAASWSPTPPWPRGSAAPSSASRPRAPRSACPRRPSGRTG